jgi:hypothetical protein
MLHLGRSGLLQSDGLVLATLCILGLTILQCQANRAKLTDKTICETLGVHHGQRDIEYVDPTNVEVYLVGEGRERSSCYNPCKSYNGK